MTEDNENAVLGGNAGTVEAVVTPTRTWSDGDDVQEHAYAMLYHQEQEKGAEVGRHRGGGVDDAQVRRDARYTASCVWSYATTDYQGGGGGDEGVSGMLWAGTVRMRDAPQLHSSGSIAENVPVVAKADAIEVVVAAMRG
jgi:hypothetical protein